MPSILYVSRLIPQSEFNRQFELSGGTLRQQSQKYHKLLAEGLVTHKNVNLTALSATPLTRAHTKKKFFQKINLTENNVKYKVLAHINLPIIRLLCMFFGTFFGTLKLAKKDTVIICDVLNVLQTAAVLLAVKLKKRKTIGIVTDVPGFIAVRTVSWVEKLCTAMIKKFDAYLYLTKEMSEIVAPDKPYAVAEGHVDISRKDVPNNIEDKYTEMVCIYSGGLDKIFGIELLAKGFIKADVPGAVMQFYGMGDYAKEIKTLSKKHTNIRYSPEIPNEVLLKEQIKATLLINPRPTHEEYTKYSFPSKNMEYISSGTPILTTKLAGMPQDYYPYVYLFEEETEDGYAKALKKVLALSREELHKKGIRAKEFAMENKNNIVQAEKLLKLTM